MEQFPVMDWWHMVLHLDQIGPVAKDVADCAAILEVIASHDKKDSTSIERDDCDFTEALVRRCKRTQDWNPKRLYGRGSGSLR